MTKRKWTCDASVSEFATRLECSAYREGWNDAIERTAAPDLYEALDRMVCLFLTKNGEDIAGARAAIAKARGEQ